LNGTAVVITARGGGSNFFHWMFDVLPRIYLLRSSKFASNQIDTFIVNSVKFNFQIQTLTQLSIPTNMIIQSEQVPHIRCQHLIVPSLTRLEGNTPAWVCEFVRTTFLPTGIKKQRQPEFLYVTRQSTTRRRVANENAVRSYLEKKGFVTIVPETLSVVEQASVFANARCVIGPHGAGLTNIVFCNPGAAIIEFFSPNCVRPTYWALSSVIGLNYYYLLGEGKPPPDGVDPDIGREDMIVNLDKLEELMKLAKVIP